MFDSVDRNQVRLLWSLNYSMDNNHNTNKHTEQKQIVNAEEGFKGYGADMTETTPTSQASRLMANSFEPKR